jgi:hypothetical protein
MTTDAGREGLAGVMKALNRAWLEGRVEEMSPLLHPEVAMALPGFGNRIGGRENLLAGFRDFAENATVHEYEEIDRQVDVAGATGVVTYRFAMVYERDGSRYRSTGRDFWIFQREGAAWQAVWRTMLEIEEHAL